MSWVRSKKRWLTLLVAVVMLSVTYRACSQPKPQPRKVLPLTWYNESDSAQKGLNYKFRGVYSGQLVVDGFGERDCVVMYDDLGEVFFNHGRVSVANQRIDDQGVFRIPATLRVVWRALDDPDCVMDGDTGIFKGGTLVGNYTVPVASRIPDELLNEIRTNRGKFRLKIRIADDGPLIGWDIESRPDYDPNKKHLYNPPYHRMVGGDFKEKSLIYFKQTPKGLVHLDPEIWEPGWYIDRKTSKRIETDF
jgi:hypothetical protein